MVEVYNIFTVDLVDTDGFSNKATVDVSSGVYEEIDLDRLVTHKRVNITLKEDDFDRDTTTIVISPVRAVALVRRLTQVLDGLVESGVELPQVHSRFTRLYLDYLYGGDLDHETTESLLAYEESCVVRDGYKLADILPPSVSNRGRNCANDN